MNIPGVNNGDPAARQTVMSNRPLAEVQKGAMAEQPAEQTAPADSYMPSPAAANETQSTLPEPIASTDAPVGGVEIGGRATDTAEIMRQDRLFDQATENNMVENLRNVREADQGTGRYLDMIV